MMIQILCVFLSALMFVVFSNKQNSNSMRVVSLANASAVLPCRPTLHFEGSSAIIILWYKNKNPEPFYSYDLRQSGNGRHWSDKNLFGRRVEFDSSDYPYKLLVNPTRPRDQGSYKCRVDYESGPSRTSVVNLQIIVLPNRPLIRNENGVLLSGNIGPYLEGKGMILTCFTRGGRPTPTVSWIQNGRVLESSSTSEGEEGTVKSILHLQHLTRNHLGASFTCVAQNNNLTKPEKTTITIDMRLAPLNVFLRRKGGSILYVREGRLEELECITVGSRPQPHLTWYRNRKKLFIANITEINLSNETISVLPMVPKLSDHNDIITCKASNPLLPGADIQTTLKLNVHYSPKVKLLKGLGLNPTAVREGADFYFECVVSANPAAYKITWLQQGVQINHNISGRIIISNQTLVLQGVGRRSAGLYQCKAINLHGYGISNDIKLNVLYSPMCSSSDVIQIKMHHKATANITCSVDAEPRNASFEWQFNSSGGIIDIDHDRFTVGDNWSILPYTPASPGDYGLLLCAARNAIGKQERPCVINVTAAEPPKLIENCQIRNQTSHSLLIICDEIKTTLKPDFQLQVRSLEDRSVVAIVRNTSAQFVASGLTPGTAYALGITAKTFLGASKAIQLRAYTVKTAEKRMEVHERIEESELNLVPIVCGCIAVTLVILLVAVILVVSRKRRNTSEDTDSHLSSFTQEERMDNNCLSQSTTSKSFSKFNETSSPDIIPPSLETQHQLEELQIAKIYSGSRSGSTHHLCHKESTDPHQHPLPHTVKGSSHFEEGGSCSNQHNLAPPPICSIYHTTENSEFIENKDNIIYHFPPSGFEDPNKEAKIQNLNVAYTNPAGGRTSYNTSEGGRSSCINPEGGRSSCINPEGGRSSCINPEIGRSVYNNSEGGRSSCS